MSRRPEDISPQSQLVYQEGKQIEGEAYIMSVYEDPSQCRLTFAAYELETDQVYTLPYSYAQLDEIFQFNSELVNPNNRDARYHWIIERLDFVLVDLQKGTKTLTLAMEKTPESAAPKMKAKVKGELTSTIDAELRAKLLGELATYDTSALQSELVKSEGARKTFLRELFAKRRIEQLKAQQRQVKVDEVREERRAKLMSNKVLLEEKAKAEKTKAEKDAKEEAAEVEEVAAEKKEAEAEKTLAEEAKEHEEAVKVYEKEKSDVEKAKEKRMKEVATYEKNAADLDSAVQALEGAIAAMEASKPSLMQLRDMQNTIQRAALMADAMGIGGARATRVIALLEQGTAAEVPEKDYEFHSGDIIDTLKGLLKDFESKRTEIEEAEEIAALNLAKFRKAQQELEETEERARLAENALRC